MAAARFSLIIHGGYGGGKNEPRVEFITQLLRDGHRRLKEGASSLDVVEEVVCQLEDSGLYNAGKGSVPTAMQTYELDAAIADGSTGRAGAVTLLTTVKNPMQLARIVLAKTKVVLIGGAGAVALARSQNLPTVDVSYFSSTELAEPEAEPEHYGTVGCVAYDLNGHLAAGTSTGGTRNKPPGRIGDSPLIGAGTFAYDATCGISCTGQGEAFILANAAHLASTLMEFRNVALADSLAAVLRRVESFGGTGGMIAIDRNGTTAFAGSQPELLCAGAINTVGHITYPFAYTK